MRFYSPNNDVQFLKVYQTYPGIVFPEPENEEPWYLEAFLSDNQFNGKEYEIKVVVFPDDLFDQAFPPGEKETYRKIQVKLYSINEEYYKYSKSYFDQMISKNNAFSEPVQVYTNIVNGAGIFTGASVSIDTSISYSIKYNPFLK